MEIVNEFKEFALQGNISETLIGFTVGVAFKDVVSSFVDNLLMPPIGYMIGRVQLQDLYIVLSGGAFESQEQCINGRNTAKGFSCPHR